MLTYHSRVILDFREGWKWTFFYLPNGGGGVTNKKGGNVQKSKKKFYNLTLQEEEAKIDHLRVVVRVTNKLDDNNRTIRRIYYH